MDIQKEKIAIEIEHGFLIGADGADLATEFCNTYVREAMIEISGLSTKEAVSFVGSVAGQSLSFMFQKVSIDQLDSILEQIKSHVITSAGVVEAQEQAND